MSRFLTSFGIFVFLTGLFSFSSCTKKKEVLPTHTGQFTETINPTPTSVTPTLRNSAPFPVGTAVDDSPMNTSKIYSTILGNEFSSITPESAMKFDRVEWKQDNFDFSAGDAMVNFALSHSQRVHGHTLVWQHALPNWVQNFSGDSTAWEGIFKNHITAMVSHYKGKVKSWDVVNEAIDDNNGLLVNNDKYGPGTGSLWRQHLGPNYIVRAFKYAHEADPASLLFYNDYGNDNGGWNSTKIKSLISIVNSVKNAGGTIAGIGIQMHINLTTDNKNITESLKQFAATGLLIHISELDISVNPSNNSFFVFSELFKSLQAEKYQFIAKTYREVVPKAQQFGITTWEFSDAYSEATLSGKNDFRLLFDTNYQKKSAYDSYLKGLMN